MSKYVSEYIVAKGKKGDEPRLVRVKALPCLKKLDIFQLKKLSKKARRAKDFMLSREINKEHNRRVLGESTSEEIEALVSRFMTNSDGKVGVEEVKEEELTIEKAATE